MERTAPSKSILIALLGLGCVSAPTPAVREPMPAPAPADAGSSRPTPTPLIEVDPAELPAPDPVAASEPAPEPAEPLPFDDEQLERIYAVQDIVGAASAAHGVEISLINGLIWVESKFEPRARGPAGAQGLMQLMPRTAGAMAKRLDRKRNSYDPDFNIHAGTLLLARLLDRFEGDERLALAGYNRGGGTVSKWVRNGQPLPEGAESFVARVLSARDLFERLPPAPLSDTPDSPGELEPDRGQDREPGDDPADAEVVAVQGALDVAPVVGVLNVDVSRQ